MMWYIRVPDMSPPLLEMCPQGFPNPKFAQPRIEGIVFC